jgi:hypothetical protein
MLRASYAVYGTGKQSEKKLFVATGCQYSLIFQVSKRGISEKSLQRFQELSAAGQDCQEVHEVQALQWLAALSESGVSLFES